MAESSGFTSRIRDARERQRVENEIRKRLDVVNARLREINGKGSAADLEQVATTNPTKINNITRLLKDVFKVFNRSLSADTYYDVFYDFERLAAIYEREPYVQRAVSYYIENTLKSEPKFVGSDSQFVDYIVMRFKEMEVVTRQDMRQFLRNVVISLLLFGNAVITKRRDPKATTGKPYVRFDGKQFDPVAGYFVEDPRLMLTRKDPVTKKLIYVRSFEKVFPKGGTFVTLPGARLFVPYNLHYMYTQESDYQEFFAEDEVIHIRWHNLIGHMWGLPPFQGVIEDLVTLRAIEECAELLVYQYGHPLIHAAVGDAQMPGSPEEIEEAEEQLRGMEGNGMLVTSGRMKLINVGQASTSNIQPYMEYFKKRVFSGLCISGNVVGEGESANKNSADTMDKTQIGMTREIQTHVSMVLSEIIKDFKYEQGIKLKDFFKEENEVSIVFDEVDPASKITLEAHYLNMYVQNGITLTEFRKLIGRKPLTESEKEDTFSGNVTMKTYEHQVGLETESQIAIGKALPKPAAGGSSGSKPKTNRAKKPSTKTASKTAGASAASKSTVTPSNQHGSKVTNTPTKR